MTPAMILSMSNLSAQVPDDLVLEDPEDIKLLMEEFPDEEKKEEVSKEDELDALKDDLGGVEFILPEDDKSLLKESGVEEKKKIIPKIVNEKDIQGANFIFDVGKEEKQLLSIAKKMQGKIPYKEWNEIASATSTSQYTVVAGDWLWKIATRVFGSGYYYSKIWSLNPYITNPHEIEPGMVLTFNTGSSESTPQVRIGKLFEKTVSKSDKKKILDDSEFSKWGDDSKPEWIKEREKLKQQGVYVQFASAETDKDLKEASEFGLLKEYEAYEPPRLPFEIDVPTAQYDSIGFDKSSKVSFNYKEGFYLNTFVSTNIVQDFGKVESSIKEGTLFSDWDRVYVRFDENIDVVVGDRFSVYSTDGEVSHKNSDRKGYKYTITGSFKTLQKHGEIWECQIIEATSPIQRGDRLTVYTPKIERITKTFNSRLVEASVFASHAPKMLAIVGDVVYLDRGRADGVEIGNIFEVYGFKDRATGKKITENPTYKNAELTVINLTDNFATALVTASFRDFYIGDLAISKTKEQAARSTKLKLSKQRGTSNRIKEKALDELDVEMNLSDMSESLLNKADKIEFTEDELAELERQEREKSIMTEGEKDLRALERLEKEITTAEKMLNEARLDEDKLLEGESLDKLEKELLYEQQESLEEIEENFGKQYLDENLNDKDNPYGLTEFDIEEIDELLNIDQVKANASKAQSESKDEGFDTIEE